MSIIAIRIRVLVAALAAGAASCTPAETHVQLPAPIPIAQWAESVDTLPGTYTLATTPIEFWDSVVVVGEGLEGVLWRIDVAARTRQQIGSKGDGPGEYRSLGTPLKMHRDSVALVGLTSMDAFPIISVATGRGRTHRIPNIGTEAGPEARTLVMAKARLRFGDTLGNVYGAPYSSGPAIDKATHRRDFEFSRTLDTVPLVRYAAASGRVDTLLQLDGGVLHGTKSRAANGSITSQMELGPYGAFNSWLPLDDGRVLIADASKYKLTVIDGSGQRMSSWTIPSNPVAVSEKGWKDWVQLRTKGAIVEMRKINDKVFAGMGAATPSQPARSYIVPEMPRTLPRLHFGEQVDRMHVVGNVAWVPVNRIDPPTSSHWDLVDIVTGQRIQTLVLPDKQYVRGVSNLGVYVYAVDDDDLQRILLYRQRTPIDSKTTPKTHQ